MRVEHVITREQGEAYKYMKADRHAWPEWLKKSEVEMIDRTSRWLKLQTGTIVTSGTWLVKFDEREFIISYRDPAFRQFFKKISQTSHVSGKIDGNS